MERIIKIIDAARALGKPINNHECQALYDGYFDNFLFNYFPLRSFLLYRRRDGARGDEIYTYFEALRIYQYSIFENLWYIYKSFTGIDEKKRTFTLLPNFSAKILMIATIREYLNAMFYLSLKDINGIHKVIIKDFKKGKRNRFGKFTDNANQIRFIGVPNLEPDVFWNLFDLRHIFYHTIRLPWWKNINDPDEEQYYYPREIIKLITPSATGKVDIEQIIRRIFSDIDAYEAEIKNKDIESLVGAKEILIKLHKHVADFRDAAFQALYDHLEKKRN